ncbi:hypothetical protein GGR53DRAFT_510610 [Hypoxylon sp. FL1150]|nr:hypothetical protein GGR53DRAFT_510610 [Hypoxylon sp. FL1150]
MSLSLRDPIMAKPRTARMPESDWYRHKAKIIEIFLFNDRTLKETVEYMFVASLRQYTQGISQYKAQLRVWKARRCESGFISSNDSIVSARSLRVESCYLAGNSRAPCSSSQETLEK